MSNVNYPISGQGFAKLSNFLKRKDLNTWGTDKDVVGKTLLGVHSPSVSNKPSLGLKARPRPTISRVHVYDLTAEKSKKEDTALAGTSRVERGT